MKLDFLCAAFSNYAIERFEDYIYIKKDGFHEPIKVFYDSDMDEYTICFATYHLHIDADAEADLVDAVSAFADAKTAVIAFYDNGQICLSGKMETALLFNISYDTLRKHFGYHNISNLTFKVYAWDKKYCFEGSFKKSKPGSVEIIRK